ncbi:MAG: hypothetical protein IJ222_02955 [Bacteroidales bacterium]|nr:hypothetical protein [Bacteroidales bacterium]
MKKTVLFIICVTAFSMHTKAQDFDNPAQTASLEHGFVRIGEISSVCRNNVGASSFLFPSGDKLVTGLHDSVSADEFMSGLKASNSRYNQIDYNLVSYGWKGSRGFHTVEIGAKVNAGLSIPKEIFQLLKTGTAQSPYDWSALRAFGNVYGEVSYGYSMNLSDNLSIGGRAKLLVGLNSVDILARKFELTTTDRQYVLDLDADIDLTNRNKKINSDEDGYLNYASFTGKGKLGFPSGAGLAMDLGVVWKPFHGFTAEASILNLGGILWYYGNGGVSSGSYTFEGLKDLGKEELQKEKIGTKLREVRDEVLGVIRPKAVNGYFKTKAVPLTAKLCSSYSLPFWEPLSVNASGLYSGYRFCAPYWEVRGGVSVSLPGIASFSLNSGCGSYGFVYGARGSVNFLSFKLYASYENGVGGTVPYESIQLKANNKRFVMGLIYLIK